MGFQRWAVAVVKISRQRLEIVSAISDSRRGKFMENARETCPRSESQEGKPREARSSPKLLLVATCLINDFSSIHPPWFFSLCLSRLRENVGSSSSDGIWLTLRGPRGWRDSGRHTIELKCQINTGIFIINSRRFERRNGSNTHRAQYSTPRREHPTSFPKAAAIQIASMSKSLWVKQCTISVFRLKIGTWVDILFSPDWGSDYSLVARQVYCVCSCVRPVLKVTYVLWAIVGPLWIPVPADMALTAWSRKRNESAKDSPSPAPCKLVCYPALVQYSTPQ